MLVLNLMYGWGLDGRLYHLSVEGSKMWWMFPVAASVESDILSSRSVFLQGGPTVGGAFGSPDSS